MHQVYLQDRECAPVGNLKIAGTTYEDDLLFGIACIVRRSLRDTGTLGAHGR